MTRHSREDALTEREFVLLVEGARSLDEDIAFEAVFAIYATGRLGLRGGELAHFRSDWVDRSERIVEVPGYQQCTKGQHGGHCGYCRNRARDYMRTHNETLEEATESVREEHSGLSDEAVAELAQKRVEENISFEEAVDLWWQPKTSTSARRIPYDFTVRLELCIERFCERYEHYPISKATINRRINSAAEAAGLGDRVYPHALRATAASAHAYREVSPYALMAAMGWSDLDTAKTYIKASDENAARELRSKHH